MKDEEMYYYDISRENAGLELLKNYPICEKLFNSPIKQFYPTNSYEQTNVGADFILENGLLIDLKSQVGEWKPNTYYDSLVLSFERRQDGIWKDCCLSKQTNIWFYPVQISPKFIEFYYIDRNQALYIKNNYRMHEKLCGGKYQRHAIIPLYINGKPNPEIHKASFYLHKGLGQLIDFPK